MPPFSKIFQKSRHTTNDQISILPSLHSIQALRLNVRETNHLFFLQKSMRAYIQLFIQHKLEEYKSKLPLAVRKELEDEKFHTNFKIVIFLSIIVYSYVKIKWIKLSNATLFQFIDFMILLFITLMKNAYHNVKKFGPRSDFKNIVGFLLANLINISSTGNNPQSIEEDFFFSSSGTLIAAFLFF